MKAKDHVFKFGVITLELLAILVVFGAVQLVGLWPNIGFDSKTLVGLMLLIWTIRAAHFLRNQALKEKGPT